MKDLYKLRFLLFIVSLLLSATYGFGSIKEGIQIDQEKKVLVAPEACSYQWYLNGEKIEGEVNQSILVNEIGHYEVESIDENGEVKESKITVAVSATGAIIKIILLGDSTVANWAASYYPETGWGQVFQYYFNSANIQVQNFAISGTTTKSFYARSDGWVAAQKVIASGDYVFIQFGHNDQKDATLPAYGAYQDYLTKYVNEIRAKKGIPVFVTSVNRNLWTGTTYNSTSLGDYPDAMRKLGVTLNVPVVDLNARSATLFSSLGQSYLANYVFNNYPAGEYPNYPTGNNDQTHFREMGAIEVSRLVIEGIKGLAPTTPSMNALIPFLKPVYEIAVSANPKASATMFTRTASYPSGMNITLKSTPKTSGTFVRWNDANNKSVGTSVLYMFTMGTAATSYAAIYKNAVITDVEETVVIDQINLYPNPFHNEFHVNLPGSFEYSIVNMEGVEVGKGMAEDHVSLGNELAKGMYVLKIHCTQGERKWKVIKN
jgi:lysophospholipase L1-like esterase